MYNQSLLLVTFTAILYTNEIILPNRVTSYTVSERLNTFFTFYITFHFISILH